MEEQRRRETAKEKGLEQAGQGSEQTFQEKLAALLEQARAKKNVLENRDVLDAFRGEILDPDKLDKIYEYLERHHVDVLRFDEEEMDPDLFPEEALDQEDEIDVEAIDLSVPDGVAVEDPIRM